MQTRHRIASLRLLTLLGVLALPVMAQAHVGVGSDHGLLHGAAHPFTGLDHLCAMIAVGLWAAQRGGKSLWIIPLTFVSVMALGGALGMSGFHLPLVEQGIVLSVLILGVLVAAAVRLPVWASSLLVGIFALLHGHAHGTEMSASFSGYAYAAGFILSTALLHFAGLGGGLLVGRLGRIQWVRLAGAAIAVAGATFWVA